MQQLTHTSSHKRASPKKSRFQTVPLYIQVRDMFLKDIEAGTWQVDTQIPNEADLARELGLSAGTVRKALDLLEFQGFLSRRQGRGTFVLDKAAKETERRIACTQASLFIIRKASEEAGHSTTPELATALQTKIAEALYSAGYLGDAGQ